MALIFYVALELPPGYNTLLTGPLFLASSLLQTHKSGVFLFGAWLAASQLIFHPD